MNKNVFTKLQKLFATIWISVLLLSPVGGLPSTPALAQSGQLVQVRVVIERVVKGDIIPLYGIGQGDPDYYARITIDGHKKNSGKAVNVADISPNWEYIWMVDRTQKSSVPVKIELFETDNQWGDFSVDINGVEGRDIVLSVDIDPCAIHGDGVGTNSCATRIQSEGLEFGNAKIFYRIEVIVPTVKVVIERIRSIDWPSLGIPGNNVFAKISIDNRVFDFDKTQIVNELLPNWTASAAPNSTTRIPITIELFTTLCSAEEPERQCFDSPVDISPGDGKGYQFTLDLLPCFVYRDNNLSEPCNSSSWIVTGNEGRKAEVQLRVEAIVAPPSGAPDLVVTGMEVTQGIQDLNNSVRLVEGKRTFVRLHVFSTDGIHKTTAQLIVRNIATGDWKRLSPINPVGGTGSATENAFITVKTNPNRGNVNDSFLFDIDSKFTSGFISLTAEVNPASNNGVHNLVEQAYGNNTISRFVMFEEVPIPEIYVYRLSFGNIQLAPPIGLPNLPDPIHVARLESWLKRVYPIRAIKMHHRVDNYGAKMLSCLDVDHMLLSKYLIDYRPFLLDQGARYYGMAIEFAANKEQKLENQGCASPVPGRVASGFGLTETNMASMYLGQSIAGSYGGHELGHTYGLPHAEFCGVKNGKFYPYDGGRISNDFEGFNALYGFDIISKTVHAPSVRDMMTYCDKKGHLLWISDFNYERLMNYFQENDIGAQATAAGVNAMTRILLLGSIEPDTKQVKLQPIYVIPNAFSTAENTPGDYAIVLRNQSHDELLRNTFAPSEVADAKDLFSFAEFVPYVNGTKSIEIVGPQGVLHTITATASAPTITLLSPNGGETVTDSPIVSWAASDPDGDVLTFMVQYSADDGKSWEVVAQNITETSVPIDAMNLTAGDKARFRVWATDGFNTASDESDAPFTIPNHIPTINIVSPISGTIISTQQTLSLQGNAYDIDLGSMPDEMLQWRSDRDGLLANSNQSSVTGLSPGHHTLTFQADDGAGAIITDTVQITVVADPTQLPTPPDELVPGSNTLVLEPDAGISMRSIYLENANLDRSLDWHATSNQPWLKLDTDAGTTPDHLTAAFAGQDLPAGLYTTTITLTSTQTSGANVVVQAQAIRLADTAVQSIKAPTSVDAGKPLLYTAVITNSGPASARPVVVDTLPKELTFDPFASTPGCSAEQGRVTCRVAQLAVDAQTTVHIAVTATVSISDPIVITNSVEVSLDGFDADYSNNITSTKTTLLPKPTADSQSPEPVWLGDLRVYLPFVQR